MDLSKISLGVMLRPLTGRQHVAGGSSLEYMQRRLRRLLPRLGRPGVVAIGLFAALLPFYFSTLRPMQEQLQSMQHMENTLRTQAKGGVVARLATSTPAEELAEFYRHFPSEKTSPQLLGKMAEIADKHGLRLRHGEYAVSREQGGRLVSFQITLPLQGRYTQIRKFLNALEAEIPAMALDNVQFVRKDAADTEIKVKVRLLLYMVQDT